MIKLLTFLPLSMILAVLPFQSGFCCAQEGGVCQGGANAVTCCQTDAPEGKYFVCVTESGGPEITGSQIGICELRDRPKDEN